MPSMTENKTFEIAMAELEEISKPKGMLPDEAWKLIEEARAKRVAWKHITAIINKHYCPDAPLTQACLTTRWERRQK